jgi:hypothetical protein
MKYNICWCVLLFIRVLFYAATDLCDLMKESTKQHHNTLRWLHVYDLINLSEGAISFVCSGLYIQSIIWFNIVHCWFWLVRKNHHSTNSSRDSVLWLVRRIHITNLLSFLEVHIVFILCIFCLNCQGIIFSFTVLVSCALQLFLLMALLMWWYLSHIVFILCIFCLNCQGLLVIRRWQLLGELIHLALHSIFSSGRIDRILPEQYSLDNIRLF